MTNDGTKRGITAVDSDQENESRRRIEKIGPSIVHYLFSASKTVQVHDLNNRATQRVIAELLAVIRELLSDENRVSIRVSEDFVVINDIRITVDPQNYGPFLYLLEEMRGRDVERIDFLPGVDENEVATFLKIFFRETSAEQPFQSTSGELAESGVKRVKLAQWVQREKRFKDERKPVNEVRQQSNQVFFRTVLIVGEVLKGIEQRRAIQVQKAERLTQQMVDIIQADESILVGLSSIKNFDEYTFTHSVNVCILSMLIADRIGFSKSDIARLGVAALLHDIGKTYIPQTILNKPGRLEGKDWELMKYHTFFGVMELSRIKALREVADGLFVALQHHVHYSMEGYPQKPGGWDLRLFSRIVTVADYFDAMTTPRVYQPPFTPDRALRFILSKSGQIFDPFIAKVFIHAMGMYPIGTVVELDTGERAVVVKQHEDRRFIHRPYVCLLGESGDEPVTLAETATGGNGFRRSIAKTFYDETAEVKKRHAFFDAPTE